MCRKVEVVLVGVEVFFLGGCFVLDRGKIKLLRKLSLKQDLKQLFNTFKLFQSVFYTN